MQHSQGMLLSVLGSVDISRHSRESGNLFPLGSVNDVRPGFPLSRE